MHRAVAAQSGTLCACVNTARDLRDQYAQRTSILLVTHQAVSALLGGGQKLRHWCLHLRYLTQAAPCSKQADIQQQVML